jgi:6-phosphogluconolactonase
VAANEISSFRIDPSSGRPSLIGSVELESDPCYLATDRNGRYLLSAYYYAGKAAVHPIGEDGAVAGPPVEWLDTAPGAHSAQTDPSNGFVIVPSIAGSNGPNLIFQFKFDEDTGRLTPNSPPRVTPEDEAGPRHYCFHPNKDVVYFSNEQGCSVTAYSFDSSSGTLAALQTVSTLPDGYAGENSCSQIQISPSGRFLYAPNRGHNSIACFSLDAASGLLTPIQRVPTQPMPRAFSLDPLGNYLYVAGEESGRLASYRVDAATGKLEPLEVYDVGEAPMWVLIAGLGQ